MALLVDNQVGDEGVTIICPTNIPPALFQIYPFLVINCRANDCRAIEPDPSSRRKDSSLLGDK